MKKRELNSLLRMCKDFPDDDGPRLDLARKLVKARDPRGHHLRLEVEQARAHRDHPLYFPHQSRLERLERRHGKAWFGALRGISSQCSSERGLVHITVDARTMLADEFAAIVASDEFAWVEYLNIDADGASADELGRAFAHLGMAGLSMRLSVILCGEEYLRLLSKSPHLKSLRNLRLDHCTDAKLKTLLELPSLADGPNLELSLEKVPSTGLRALTTSPLWAHLTHLEVGSGQPMRSDAATLARAPAAKLRSLNFGFNRLEDDVITLLASSALFNLCQRLDLSWNEISDVGLTALVQCPGLSRLRSLDLAGNRQIRATGVHALATSPHLADLERLSLYEVRIGRKGAEALASGLPRLSVLNLWSSGIGDEGLAALARAGRRDLSVLNLPSNQIGDVGLEALAQHHQGKNLRCLHLWKNQVGPRGLRALADSPLLRSLSGLLLHRNQVGDDGVQALTEGKPVNLLELELDKNGIGPEGAQRLAGCAALKRLRNLSLNGNPIGDKGVKALAESPYLTKLDALLLDKVDMTEAGAAALVASKYLPWRMALQHSGNKLSSKARAALSERFEGEDF